MPVPIPWRHEPPQKSGPKGDQRQCCPQHSQRDLSPSELTVFFRNQFNSPRLHPQRLSAFSPEKPEKEEDDEAPGQTLQSWRYSLGQCAFSRPPDRYPDSGGRHKEWDDQ